jgi:DNA-binding transcriptional MocR family regulator
MLAEDGDLHRWLAYAPEGGHPAHREAGAAWVRRSGLAATPEETLVCGGSQHALVTVFSTLFAPGDRVLTDALTYPGMKAVAALLRLRLVGVPFDEDGLLPDAFEASCQAGAKAVYCAPTIQNPTATVMPLSRRAEIAAIARRYGLLIVEDDVHALLTETLTPPIATFAPETSLFIVSTSKVLAPGLRVAFIRSPLPHAGRLAAGIRTTTWGTPPLMAEIVSRWIRSGEAESILASRRREAFARQALAAAVLAGATLRAHPSGYHLWLHLQEPWHSDTFTAEARSRGVLVTPASVFSAGEGPVPNGVRLCLGAAGTREDLERGLARIHETLSAVPQADGAVV